MAAPPCIDLADQLLPLLKAGGSVANVAKAANGQALALVANVLTMDEAAADGEQQTPKAETRTRPKLARDAYQRWPVAPDNQPCPQAFASRPIRCRQERHPVAPKQPWGYPR